MLPVSVLPLETVGLKGSFSDDNDGCYDGARARLAANSKNVECQLSIHPANQQVLHSGPNGFSPLAGLQNRIHSSPPSIAASLASYAPYRPTCDALSAGFPAYASQVALALLGVDGTKWQT